MSDDTAQPRFPINRIVAFLGPYIAILSGAIADWLVVHVHLLSLFHTTSTAITSWLTQGLVFGLTAILVWLGHQKWLTGWQRWEQAVVNSVTGEVAGDIFNGPDVNPPGGVYDQDAEPPGPTLS